MKLGLSLALLASLAACRESQPAPPPDGKDSEPTANETRAIAAKARELAALASQAEPAITERVRALAAEAGAELSGLEHRLKTLPSLERKIRSRTRDNPELTIARPDIVDALRYTVVVDPASYAAAVRSLLGALEGDGHEVVRVKNYWPPGDNYSGVNVVLRRGELQWEIQFHTPESVVVRDAWHPAYEQLRERDTPIERRRWLYALMAVPWDQVAVPEGLDREGALHPREEIRRYPPP